MRVYNFFFFNARNKIKKFEVEPKTKPILFSDLSEIKFRCLSHENFFSGEGGDNLRKQCLKNWKLISF